MTMIPESETTHGNGGPQLLDRTGRPFHQKQAIEKGFRMVGGWYYASEGGNEEYEIGENYEDFAKAYRCQVWVRRCVDLLAASIASVPVRLMRRDEKGLEHVVTDHPVVQLLADVNPTTMNASDLWRATVVSLKIFGNAYWYLERRGNKTPQEIYWLKPSAVEIVASKDPTEYIKAFKYDPGRGGQIALYSPADVIHFKYFNPDNEFYGLSPITSIKEDISGDLYAQAWNKYFFKNSARADGFYSVQQPLTPQQRKEMRRSIEALHGGVKRAHRVGFLEGGTRFEQLSTTPKDAEWRGAREDAMNAICSCFGVPPVLVGGYKSVNYATALEQKKSFWHETILPELRWLEEVLNWNLIPEFPDAYGKGYWLRFDTSEIVALLEETTTRYERIQKATGGPLLSINEGRSATGLPPIEGGDVVLVPMNMIPLDDLTKAE